MFETQALAFMLFIFGACFGSFANVVIYRLPEGLSIVSPRSRCGSCGKPVAWYNNIPILAWFWLRGRCANCQAKFSFRYPFVELLMATLFALAALRFGYSWTLIEALIFIFGLVTVSFIDIDHMILPDKFTWPGMAIGLIGAALNPERPFIDALFGAALGFGFLWAISYLYFVFRGREGMGGGDIKLLGWIGAVLGWKAIPLVILLSSVLGSIVGVTLALRHKGEDSMQQPIPFGPYLAGAALIYLLANGPEWANWYLGLHGL